ncbi:AAA family ATPase [Spiroplasma endosymbiont of Dioctria linearis]|uniref:AAA family ATPase n=1 Tax=Spiroplasma endosymbiont of Dioctria linearis TaxID=3066290 RepID=UPI00313C07F8
MKNKINELFIDAIKNIYNNSDEKNKIITIMEVKKILAIIDKSIPNADSLKRNLINAIGINRVEITNAKKITKHFVISDLDILENIENDMEIINYLPPFIEKINYMISKLNNGLYKEVSLKMLIYGKPGTGKTTLIKYISKKTGLPLYYVKSANVISSFLGDTQKNFEKLKKDIEKVDGKGIVLIDEIDSILGDRNTATNDEYRKIIGAFNIMLDSIKKNAIVISITNNVKLIDSAITRRFNVKLELDYVTKEEFEKALINKLKQNNIMFDKITISKIIKLIEAKNVHNLNYSVIDSIVEDNLFFDNNIYSSLFANTFDFKFNYDNLKSDTKKLESIGFNTTDISKILDLDRRTVKNKIESNEIYEK